MCWKIHHFYETIDTIGIESYIVHSSKTYAIETNQYFIEQFYNTCSTNRTQYEDIYLQSHIPPKPNRGKSK